MSRVAVPSPEPRRLATPRWLDLRLVLGIVLVVASVLIGAVVVSRASDTYAIVTVTRDLSAGTILRSDDVAIAHVQLPGRSAYLAAAKDAVGKQLARDVTRGELLPAAAVMPVASRTTLTVPFAADAAPRLRAGQRIEVWVSTQTCASVVLLRDVTVQSVQTDAGGSFSSGSTAQNVVISVEPALADRVIAALAIDQAQIRAGVLVGSAPSVPSSTPSSGTPAGGTSVGQLPDDLVPCASASPSR
jgi:hypothetical protein